MNKQPKTNLELEAQILDQSIRISELENTLVNLSIRHSVAIDKLENVFNLDAFAVKILFFINIRSSRRIIYF